MSCTSAVDAILKERLFGYGTPYRVEVGSDGVVAVDSDAVREAETLSQLLANLTAQVAAGPTRGQRAGGWAYSLPFGRCGVDSLPREHIQVYFFCEAYIDVLSYDGVNSIALKEGQSICIEPRTVVRLRARTYSGQRVLVAFQTQDHTPLAGNAGPFVADGVVADDWRERISVCHAAFSAVAAMDAAARKEVLDIFFARMAAALEGKAEIGAMQHAARAAGSYAVVDEDVCFVRQGQLLSTDVIERIRARDEAVFRFPGMFGAVAPLFNLLT